MWFFIPSFRLSFWRLFQINPHVFMWQFANAPKIAYQKQKLSKMLTGILAFLTFVVFNFHNFIFQCSAICLPRRIGAPKCILYSLKFTNILCTYLRIICVYTWHNPLELLLHTQLCSSHMIRLTHPFHLHMLLFAFIRFDALCFSMRLVPLSSACKTTKKRHVKFSIWILMSLSIHFWIHHLRRCISQIAWNLGDESQFLKGYDK